MFASLSHNYKAILLAIIGFTGFSVSDACAKYLSADYTVFQITGGIAMFSMTWSLLYALKTRTLAATLLSSKRKFHIMRGLSNTAISLLVVLSFSKLPFAFTYTIFFASPFIAALLAIPVFKEKIDWHGALAIFIGFIGVIVVLRPGVEAISPWVIAPIIATFFIAALFLLARALGNTESIISLAFYPAASNLIFALPIAIYTSGLPHAADLPVFILASICVMTGLICTANAFRIAKFSIVGPFHYIQMIWAVLLGYFIFGEFPDTWTFIGGAIIIASGLYMIGVEEFNRNKK